MEHHFNTKIAAIYGVHEAVFLHNLYYWISKNEANGRHYFEGRNWTYNSLSALQKLFPYFTKSQLRTVIANCESKGAIIKGNFNKVGYDNTIWYALTEDIWEIYGSCDGNSTCYANSGIGCAENSTGYARNRTTIPDSKPYINPDSKPDISSKKQKAFVAPTLDEIKAYCKSRNSSVEPIRFYEYFTADTERQWIDAMGNPVKSWKQKLVTWESKQSKVSDYGKPQKQQPNYDYQGDDTL